MQSSALVELAAIVAHHGPCLIEGTTSIPAKNLNQYWTASKCRLDRWTTTLNQHSAILRGASPVEARQHWDALSPVLEEILTGEALVRVWAAIVSAFDQKQCQCEASPVTRSVYIGHLEARNRVLQLMVYGQGALVTEVVSLNRLRRRVERWTDMLLGLILMEHDVAEFTIEPERATNFASDFRNDQRHGRGIQTWPLMLASLRAAFPPSSSLNCPNSDLNEEIAAGILTCFPNTSFDSLGLLRSMWQTRLENTTQEAAGLLENLLAEEAASEALEPTPNASRFS